MRQMPGEQEGKQRKGRQGIVKKLRVNEGVDEKNGDYSRDEVLVDPMTRKPFVSE